MSLPSSDASETTRIEYLSGLLMAWSYRGEANLLYPRTVMRAALRMGVDPREVYEQGRTSARDPDRFPSYEEIGPASE